MARETGIYRRGIPATGGLLQHYPTASAYAKALGLKTEKKPKPCSPS